MNEGKEKSKDKRKWGGFPRTPYEALGIPPNATKEEIRTAWRRMSCKYHPDVNPDNQEEAKEWSQIINEAKDALLKHGFKTTHFKNWTPPPGSSHQSRSRDTEDNFRERQERAERQRREEEERKRQESERARREEEEDRKKRQEKEELERLIREEAERRKKEEEQRQETERKTEELRKRNEKIAEIKARMEAFRSETGQTTQGAAGGSRNEKEAEIRARIETSRGEKTEPNVSNKKAENQDYIRARIRARIEASKSEGKI